VWAKLATDMAAAQDVCGIDVETQDEGRHEGLNAFNNKTRHVFDHRRTVMTGFSVYPDGGDTAYYFNLNHADVENRLPPETVDAVLEMKPEGVTWVAHNAPFELVMFEQCYGVKLTNIICSLQMAVSDHGPDEYDLQAFYNANLNCIRPIVPDIIENYRSYTKGDKLDPDQQFVLGQFIGKETDAAFSYNGFVKSIAWGYSLKRLTKSFFGVDQTTYEQVLDGRAHMGELTGEDVCAYGADDAYWAVRVYRHLLAKMMRENPAALVAFLETENPMIHVYADVWREGLRINTEEVFKRRNDERVNYACALREFKRALSSCLPFPSEPNEALLHWQPWYSKWEYLRQRLIDWIDSPDCEDDFEQCFQVSNPIGNAWAIEKGLSVPRTGKLNLTHYYQMRLILHDLLGHKLVRISGDITTDKDARSRMAETFKAAGDDARLEVLSLITKLSSIEQVMKLYLTPYTQLMDPETGCLYSVISSMLASRRLGARFPNPMQLAKRGESTYVRGFYLADRDDHVIISADWSSVELVEIGDFSGDPEFARCFSRTPYEDLHSGAAVDCLKVDPRYSWLTEEEFLEFKRGLNPMSRDLRDFADRELPPQKWFKLMRTEVGKGANFSFWYSGALGTLADKFGWDSTTHWGAVDRYRERFAVAEAWRVGVIADAVKNGFVTLPDGHRRVRLEATPVWYTTMIRKFADVCSDPAVMSFAELALPRLQTRAKNQAVNSMIQGTCATLAKRSILNISEKANSHGARFMLPIHDELLFSVHRDYVPEFIPILRKGMCNHPDIIKNLQLTVNVAVGRTFKPWDGSKMSQLELDEAPVIEGLIPDEFDGKPLPPEFYPKVIEWQMVA
jgi:DNA polymerase I-like protein with 3'-5' exonuclease and polymerase domains